MSQINAEGENETPPSHPLSCCDPIYFPKLSHVTEDSQRLGDASSSCSTTQMTREAQENGGQAFQASDARLES